MIFGPFWSLSVTRIPDEPKSWWIANPAAVTHALKHSSNLIEVSCSWCAVCFAAWHGRKLIHMDWGEVRNDQEVFYHLPSGTDASCKGSIFDVMPKQQFCWTFPVQIWALPYHKDETSASQCGMVLRMWAQQWSPENTCRCGCGSLSLAEALYCLVSSLGTISYARAWACLRMLVHYQ